jgi:AsmA protein
MSLGLLPLRFQVKNTAIADDPSLGSQTPFVQAESLDIRVRLLPLLSGNVQVDSVELRRPGVELIRTKDGTWNFASLRPAAAPAAADSPASTPAAEREFSLQRLTIVDGQIGITDLQASKSRLGYDHINLTLTNFNPRQPFDFDLAAAVEGEPDQELRLKGQAGPIAAASPSDTPFRGTLSLSNVSIGGLLKFLNVQVITKALGTLSGQGEITGQSGTIATNGQLRLEGANINDLDVGYPITLDYKLGTKVADQLINIDNATLQLGEAPLALTGTLNTATTPPNMDLKIKSGDVSVTELARLASAFGVALARGTSVTGRVRVDAQAKGSTAQPELTGTLAGKDLAISGGAIPQPIQVQALDLTFTPTAIRSNEFTATSGKTTLLGQISLLQYASKSPGIDLALRSTGATLPEIQSMASAYGFTGLNQINGAGNLNFDLRAKGPVESLNKTAAIKALNGTINLDFSPLKIAGFDTAHELGKLGGFASNIVEQGQTDIIKLTGRIDVKNGMAQTNDLRAQFGIGNLSASGTSDLAAESLDLKVSAVFTKEFTEKIGTLRGGRLLNTALTNTEGELVLPALVSGNFQKPKFAPDLKAVAQLQKQKYLPSLENPAATVGRILDVFKKKPNTETPPGQTADTPEQPAGQKPSVLKGILDALGGQKKDPEKK